MAEKRHPSPLRNRSFPNPHLGLVLNQFLLKRPSRPLCICLGDKNRLASFPLDDGSRYSVRLFDCSSSTASSRRTRTRAAGQLQRLPSLHVYWPIGTSRVRILYCSTVRWSTSTALGNTSPCVMWSRFLFSHPVLDLHLPRLAHPRILRGLGFGRRAFHGRHGSHMGNPLRGRR